MSLRLCALVVLAGLASPALAQSLPSWGVPMAPAGTSGPAESAPSSAQALPPQPGGNGGAPAQVPVDGGLALLALAGAGYASRRLRARR